MSEHECTEHLYDEIQRLRESNFHLREGAEELKQRIKRLESENDSMRADLLLWGDNLRLQQRINRLEEENDALRADLLLWNEKEAKL